MLRGWEGNRRSGVALAMRHGLKRFIHDLRAQRPRVGDEHPAYAPAGAWLPLPLPLPFIVDSRCGGKRSTERQSVFGPWR